MQNQQEVTFVFGNSVKGFLKRYQATPRFAQEARRKAAGVLDGNVRLVCPEALRPQALRLLRRLKNSDIELFSFFVKKGESVEEEFSRRLERNADFAKFVFHQVAPAFAAGRLDLRCKKEDRRTVKALLQKCWDEQSSTHNGWETLVKKEHPLTKELTLTQVLPWTVEEDSFTVNSGRDFKVIRRLGYLSTITWEEAAELDAKDPTHRVHLHSATAPGVEHQRALREDRSDDILDNPNFGDYEDKERRDSTNALADHYKWQQAKERWDELEVEGSISDFVPPLAPQKSGRGGSVRSWAMELGRSVRVTKAAPITDGPRWPHRAPSDEWLAKRKGARKAAEEVAQRQALLDADDAEVTDNAEADVPETVVYMLEQQLKDVGRKAPKGVVAALAHARLEASRNAKRISEQVRGLADLEAAVAAH